MSPGRFAGGAARVVLVLGALGPALFAPVFFGSQDLYWSALWLAPLALAALMCDPARLPREARLVLLLALLSAVLATVAGLAQMIGRPDGAGHWIWTEAGAVLGEALPTRAGVSARPAYMDMIPAILALLALFAGMALSRWFAGSRKLLKVVLAVGTGMALIWLLLHLSDPGAVMWRMKTHHQGSLTGTFLNRNVAAAYLSPALAAGALLLADALVRASGGTELMRRRGGRLRATSGAAVIALALGVIFLVLMLTESRAGLILSIGAATVAVFLAMLPAWRTLNSRWRRRTLWFAAAAMLCALTLSYAVVARRFDSSTAVDQNRFAVYAITWRIALDHWLYGAGLGQFASIFTAYRDATVPGSGVWERAHNTYLQIAAEAGFPVLAAVLCTVGVALAALIRRSLATGDGRIAAAFGVAVVLQPALHSLVDYPAQIPGYAIPIGLLVGYVLGTRARSGIVGRGVP